MDTTEKRELLEGLVRYLVDERRIEGSIDGKDADELWTLFRALVNTRQPGPADPAFTEAQDTLLKALIADAGIATIDDATPAPADPRLSLWRGDITTLQVDGIVNAANSQMLGCWQPGHYCIDNAIHTFAGIQLREECARIMQAQGHEEPTAEAKVTSAWNLPSRYVIHTVGPIAAGHPTDLHRAQLAQCYERCLDAALEHDMRTIAFCCISTGVFGFPQEEAAHIAIDAVRSWLDAHAEADIAVIFNVFGETDEAIYKGILGI
ncbi:MAG: protein-ADP-ribose hydrolase [Eggerthellaceae bacterium]|nr:protein-ADP-ribose hydrolase [Eggerthellaceae bacterium]